MSSDAIRRLMMSREPGNGVGPPGGDDDEDFSAPAFSVLRGMRDRAGMFEIRHRDGRIDAFTYAMLDRAEFDPSEGITLHFGRSQVKLVGRNLNLEIRPHVTLFGSILRGKVPWVAEADRPAAYAAGPDDVVIERVVIE
jgi:hypothetical protein